MEREKGSSILRLVAGGYLIYLAYNIFTGVRAGESGNPVIMTGAAAIFAILGCVIVYFGFRGLSRQGSLTNDVETEEEVSKDHWVDSFGDGQGEVDSELEDQVSAGEKAEHDE